MDSAQPAFWLKDPLGILADGAERGLVVQGSRIVELVPAGGIPATPERPTRLQTTAADRDARRRRVRSQSDAATTRDHTPGADLVNGDVSALRGRLARSGGSAGRCGGVTDLHLPDFSGCKAQLQNLAALAQVLLI